MLGLLRNPRAVVAVNVTVHEQLWPVLLEQLVEAVKAAVGDGVKVVQVPRGTVGDEYVKALVEVDFRPEPENPPFHLALGVHVLTVSVAERAAQSDKADTLVLVELVVDTDAALGLALEVVVVVSVYVEQRDVHHRHQKLQIFLSEVSAADDELNALDLIG